MTDFDKILVQKMYETVTATWSKEMIAAFSFQLTSYLIDSNVLGNHLLDE